MGNRVQAVASLLPGTAQLVDHNTGASVMKWPFGRNWLILA